LRSGEVEGVQLELVALKHAGIDWGHDIMSDMEARSTPAQKGEPVARGSA
jgi:hypothetical protein